MNANDTVTSPEVPVAAATHAQELPPEIAKLLSDIGHALAKAPKALLLVNEEADVISPFLEAYLVDSLRQACPGRQVAMFKPNHPKGPTAALAEALSEFIPGLTPELFLGIEPGRRVSFVRMMLKKENLPKDQRNAPASHILIVDRLEEARSGQHDDRAEFCDLLDTLAQESWFGCAIAMGIESGEICEKAAGLSALLRQSSRVDLQNGMFKLAGRGKSGETRIREPRSDRRARPALMPMALSALSAAAITAAVFLGGAHFFNVDWRSPLGLAPAANVSDPAKDMGMLGSTATQSETNSNPDDEVEIND
ncbi:MAG: hypothetical protein AAF585_08795 [Verrucomicrobiota bacterium]